MYLSLLKVFEQPYGARVEFLINSPEYSDLCKCEDLSCKHHKYILLDSILYVKRADDLLFLASYLDSLTYVWTERYTVDDSDTE